MSEMIHNFTLSNEYGLPPLDPETLARFARTILVILGADGKISPKELEAFMDLGRRVGAPPEGMAAIQTFDWKNANLKDNLPAVSGGWKGLLLYLAIMVASADEEYHPSERAKVHQAAEALGVNPALVAAIEGVAAAEIALRNARVELFKQA
jgi:uncharacterized tellurite resistance protein B-like protein